jgi:hypothetical protein
VLADRPDVRTAEEAAGVLAATLRS